MLGQARWADPPDWPGPTSVPQGGSLGAKVCGQWGVLDPKDIIFFLYFSLFLPPTMQLKLVSLGRQQ